MGVGRCGSEKKVTATIKYTSKSYNLLSKYEIKSTPHLVFYPYDPPGGRKGEGV